MENTTPKHTPGPWKWLGTMNGLDLMVIPDNLSREDETLAMNGVGRIAMVMGIQAGMVEVERPTYATANAHLIAASPDLLAACEAFLTGQNQTEARRLARAAIAKAKGE